jgi:hypothetical protein
MMQSHFVLIVTFSLLVSTVFAALMREDAKEQLTLGAKMFGAIVLGWLMYPFPI